MPRCRSPKQHKQTVARDHVASPSCSWLEFALSQIVGAENHEVRFCGHAFGSFGPPSLYRGARGVFIATPVDPVLYLFPVLAAKVADKFRTHQDILEGYEVRRGGGLSPTDLQHEPRTN